MSERLDEILGRLRERFPEAVSEPSEAAGWTAIEVAPDALPEVARWLRDEASFALLSNLSAADYLGIEPPERRYLLVCHLRSLREPLDLALWVWVPEHDPRCPTLTGIYPAANYQEREAYDFFGITFDGHPHLQRILNPDDWDGYPHRKDYPLGGVRVEFKGHLTPPPDQRGQPATTTGYPGRLS